VVKGALNGSAASYCHVVTPAVGIIVHGRDHGTEISHVAAKAFIAVEGELIVGAGKCDARLPGESGCYRPCRLQADRRERAAQTARQRIETGIAEVLLDD